MQTTQGSLVIIGANTSECKVFWNGNEVPNGGITVDNDADARRVVIKVLEDPLLAKMATAGVVFKRI